MADTLNHLKPELVRNLDIALGDAIELVEDGRRPKASVGLAFTIEKKDGVTVIAFTLRDTATQKGEMLPLRNGGEP